MDAGLPRGPVFSKGVKMLAFRFLLNSSLYHYVEILKHHKIQGVRHDLLVWLTSGRRVSQGGDSRTCTRNA